MKIPKILYVVSAILFLASCGADSPQVETSSGAITRERAVRIADEASRKAVRIPKEVAPIVEETAEAFIMTFPMTFSKRGDPSLVPDYYTKVTVSKTTGKITELLVAP